MSQAYTSQESLHSTFISNRSSLFNETSSNRSGEEQEQSTPIAAVSLLILISFLGAIGNLLVLKAIFSLKRRKLHEYLLLNLAATDAGTCLVSIPLDITEQLIGRFPYGAALCRVIYPIQSVLVYASVLTLLFMSAERYRLIVTPMKPRIQFKTGIITIISIWVLSCLVVLPFSLALVFTGSECIEQWPKEFSGKAFTLTIFIFLYLVPLFIMTFFYSTMVRVFYKDIKSLKMKREIPVSRESIDIRLQRNVKIVKVFVVAVVVFALCMLPTHVTWLWHDFGGGSSSPEFRKVSTFSNIFMYCNSVLNPLFLGSIMIDGKALARRCWKLFCCRSRQVGTRHDFDQAYVLHICSPSMSKQYKNGSYILSLSKSSLCDNKTVTATKITCKDI